MGFFSGKTLDHGYPTGTRVQIESNAHLPIVKRGDPATVLGPGNRPGTYSVVVDSYSMRPPITVTADELRPADRLEGGREEFRTQAAAMQMMALLAGAPFATIPATIPAEPQTTEIYPK